MDEIYESDISGIRAGASQGVVPELPPIVTRTVIVPAAFNGGRPFASERCTDDHVPSMLAAKNYVDSSVAGKKQGAAVGITAVDTAAVTVVPGVKFYDADFSAGSESVSLTFDLTGISGAVEFYLWAVPAEGHPVSFPASVIWFDGQGPGSDAMADSDKRYLYQFVSPDGISLFGRFLGSADRETAARNGRLKLSDIQNKKRGG